MYRFYSLVFMPYLLNAVICGKSPFYFSRSLKLLVLLIHVSRPVACSARTVMDRQTDTHTHTHTHTHTQTNYGNPRCTCMPRVNKNGVIFTTHTFLFALPISLTSFRSSLIRDLLVFFLIIKSGLVEITSQVSLKHMCAELACILFFQTLFIIL